MIVGCAKSKNGMSKVIPHLTSDDVENKAFQFVIDVTISIAVNDSTRVDLHDSFSPYIKCVHVKYIYSNFFRAFVSQASMP